MSQSYTLEYGEDTLELHEDAVAKGERVVIVDDLLATGGTLAASCSLVEKLGAKIVGCSVLVELGFLKGRGRLEGQTIHSIINYED